MTSITSSTSSPLSILQSSLTSLVSTGQINSADQSLLSNELTDIGQSLSSDSSSSTSQQSSPQDLKNKIGSLIDQQVADGTLTSDQADELKSVFSNAAASSGRAVSGDATGATSDASQTDTLSTFLETLQGNTSQSSYSADGQTTSTQPLSLVLNFTA